MKRIFDEIYKTDNVWRSYCYFSSKGKYWRVQSQNKTCRKSSETVN